jgi:hypothetical protein
VQGWRVQRFRGGGKVQRWIGSGAEVRGLWCRGAEVQGCRGTEELKCREVQILR